MQHAAVTDLLTSAKSPLFIYGPDAATGERGWATVTALNNLAMLLGQGDKVAYVGREANAQGCRDMGLLPDALPGQLPTVEAAVRDRLGKLWGIQPPAQAGRSYAQMLGGGVQGLWVVGLNPAAEPATAEALRKLDFLVVQDLFLTETAGLADVVLPSCSFAEADGTYTNLERRVQRGPQGIQAFSQSRADWSILTALAEKWLAVQVSEVSETLRQGSEQAAEASKLPDWKRKKRKVKTGPVARPWNYPNAQAVLEEIGKAVPFYAGLRWDALGAQGQQWPVSALARSRRSPDVRKPETAESASLAAPAPGSYRLVSSPVLWSGDTLMQKSADTVRHLIPEPFIALNPSDISASLLVEGSRVSVTSSEGSVSLVLRGDASVQPGTAWVPVNLAGAPAETLGNRQGEPVLVKLQGI
jgi:predicted molibdopterin-dependent oxidoreductase YjgC